MKRIIILFAGFFVIVFNNCSSSRDGQSAYRTVNTTSLPAILSNNHSDIIESRLKHEANLRFAINKLPDNREDWETYRTQLKNEIIKKAGVVIDHQLPLNIRETGIIRMKGYTVKNITFQTRPGIYATANLYVPDGPGPFPAVINMIGHFAKSRIDTVGPQPVGHSLALNGYVCLSIDPWGAGERGTTHAKFEYHGSNLGASIMNIGETLMGIQISDNMRGVDLLCSLPNVDPANVGATGASGGGNQTMWLAAVDERVRAAVPVVSVGTFESYVMRSNCICEVLIDGLTFTEEAGVIALSRAIMPCNHIKDSYTFSPGEMLRSYGNAKPVFEMMGAEKNISYKIFDLTHGYLKEDREAMLGWFDLHLKGIGTGAPKKEIPFKQIAMEKLMVFPGGQRDTGVLSTDEYCRRRGNELRSALMNTKSFDSELKREELRNILRLGEKSVLQKVHEYPIMGGWERFALETSDEKLIPVLHLLPQNKSLGYIIICNTEGKNNVDTALLDELIKNGSGIVIVDLSGTGEVTSTSTLPEDRIGRFHTLSRAELWLGKTLIGEWVKELTVVTRFLNSRYNARKISIDGNKEAGLAGLFLSAISGKLDSIILRNAPVSYLFDKRESVDFFSMGIHLPGFLNWGDISLATALSGINVTFINPVTMSGQKITGDRLNEYLSEFERIRSICRLPGKTFFN